MQKKSVPTSTSLQCLAESVKIFVPPCAGSQPSPATPARRLDLPSSTSSSQVDEVLASTISPVQYRPTNWLRPAAKTVPPEQSCVAAKHPMGKPSCSAMTQTYRVAHSQRKHSPYDAGAHLQLQSSRVSHLKLEGLRHSLPIEAGCPSLVRKSC